MSWVVGVVGKKSIEKSDKVKYWKTNRKRKSPTPWLPGFSRLLLRPLPDISLATWDLAPLSLHHCTKDMLLMKIYRYLSDHREIIETDVKYVETCNLQKVWDAVTHSMAIAASTSCPGLVVAAYKLQLILIRSTYTVPMISGVFLKGQVHGSAHAC